MKWILRDQNLRGKAQDKYESEDCTNTTTDVRYGKVRAELGLPRVTNGRCRDESEVFISVVIEIPGGQSPL